MFSRYFICIYPPPGNPVNCFVEFQDFLANMATMHNEFYIVGSLCGVCLALVKCSFMHDQVVTDMTKLQQLLTQPCNIRIHLAAPVEGLVQLGIAPNTVWEKNFLNAEKNAGTLP